MQRYPLRLCRLALAAAAVLGAASAQAGIFPVCPPDAIALGINANGTGLTESNAPRVCYHLAAGDGWINYASGERSYIFGFSVADPAPGNVMVNSAL